MTTRESRLSTEAAPEVIAATKPIVSRPADNARDSVLTTEDRLAAFVAGYELGKAERVVLEIEDRARAMLHKWATESRGMATEYASRVGPNWTALVLDSGDRDD